MTTEFQAPQTVGYRFRPCMDEIDRKCGYRLRSASLRSGFNWSPDGTGVSRHRGRQTLARICAECRKSRPSRNRASTHLELGGIGCTFWRT